MKSIDEITVKDVHSLVDSKIFQRGTEYFNDGCVLNPTQDGNEISAEVEGSSSSNYKTLVKLERGKIKCECDCPYDWGVCKHVIALLLNWVNNPMASHGASDSNRHGILQLRSLTPPQAVGVFSLQ
ncbi:MAG: hypothetical protein KGH66_01170 [Candidatus Micrarchaeota archaeon]|nr:hypothetical protein [Candidatus Micrarchaeota archaeon]